MRLSHRIARLEDRTKVGIDRDGHCRYCHEREKELGGQVVVRRERNDRLAHLSPSKPDPGPTPCPHCGRDMNTYVVVNYVSRLTPEQEERAAEISAEREQR